MSIRRHRRIRHPHIIASSIITIAALTAAITLAQRSTFESASATPVVPAAQQVITSVAPTGTSAISYPRQGPDTYTIIPGHSAVLGSTGTLLRFQVAVENGIANLDPASVATMVEATYSDVRGWTAGRAWRFQRVGPGQPHDYVLYLATPDTRDKLCGDGPDGYTSCRNGNKVVINIARWAHAVPGYGASLNTYRQYAINHETGHLLGFIHELCAGPGNLAPVMQQQTLGLHDCSANAWPYVNGNRYSGNPGQYLDPIPAE
jgi:hypothetical protein